MHEMGIACSVLDTVERERQRHPRMRPAKVGLRIGEFSGVDDQSLRFCFEAAAMSYDLSPLELEVTWCRAAEGHRGDELDLAFIELEDLVEVNP
jgi:Zn finger protein HypA/HybF involved in hydrogenase expression